MYIIHLKVRCMMVDKKNVSLFIFCVLQLLNSVAQGFCYQHISAFAILTLKASSKSPVQENDLAFYAIFVLEQFSAVGNQGTKCEIMIMVLFPFVSYDCSPDSWLLSTFVSSLFRTLPSKITKKQRMLYVDRRGGNSHKVPLLPGMPSWDDINSLLAVYKFSCAVGRFTFKNIQDTS